MLVHAVIGKLSEAKDDREIDWLELEWEELNKRILRKTTLGGREISISLEPGAHLHVGDVMFEDESVKVVIRTVLEPVYVVKPQTIEEMGKIAFEIGNRHTPCIITNNEIVIRYDQTLERLFEEVGVNYEQTERRFTEPFKYKGHHHH